MAWPWLNLRPRTVPIGIQRSRYNGDTWWEHGRKGRDKRWGKTLPFFNLPVSVFTFTIKYFLSWFSWSAILFSYETFCKLASLWFVFLTWNGAPCISITDSVSFYTVAFVPNTWIISGSRCGSLSLPGTVQNVCPLPIVLGFGQWHSFLIHGLFPGQGQSSEQRPGSAVSNKRYKYVKCVRLVWLEFLNYRLTPSLTMLVSYGNLLHLVRL